MDTQRYNISVNESFTKKSSKDREDIKSNKQANTNMPGYQKNIPNMTGSLLDDNLIELKGKRFRKTQACDRCRLKKIKCDGGKPTCGNCLKAKFHCVTSDKLSRRGFPKGYTEALEQELIKLKKILKDNNIEITKETDSNGINKVKPKLTTVFNISTENTQPLQSSADEGSVNFNFTSISPIKQSNTTQSPVANHLQDPQIKNISQENPILVNDTFHKQKNVIYSEKNCIYMGNNFWNRLMSCNTNRNSKVVENNFYNTLEREEKIIHEQHISLMVNLLNLNPRYYYLPQFLVQKYKYDENLLKNLLVNSIQKFFKVQNSLTPLLYPTNYWKNSLIDLLSKFQYKVYSERVNPDIKPHLLLCLLIIIQIDWSCMDNLRLLQVIRLISVNSFFRNVKQVQVLNLSTFLFMGHGQKSTNENLWTSAVVVEILNLNLSLIKDIGLYINPKNLKPLIFDECRNTESAQNNEVEDRSIPVVTYWCFEFLNSWWCLLQGLPRTNFIMSEFQPKILPISKKNGLIPFSILINYITEKINGYNLFHCLKNGLGSKVIVANEFYRDILKSKNLYFYSIEKDISFEKISEAVKHKGTAGVLKKNVSNDKESIILEKSEIIEIQLTLYYLLMTLILHQKYQFSRDNLKRIGYNTDCDSVAYEILCLYYLLMKSEANYNGKLNEEQVSPPLQFTVTHILPCSNEDIIKLTLDILIEWGSNQKKKLNSRTSVKHVKNEEVWRFKKYKNFLYEWCQLWFESTDQEDLQYLKIKSAFDIDLEVDRMRVMKYNYFRSLEEFNNLGYSNNILLKTDSKAIMDQFNIFGSSINNISSLLQPSLNSLGMNASKNGLNILSQNVDVKLSDNSNTDNNILQDDKSKDAPGNIFPFTNSVHLVSSVLGKQEETDDGYAEDDDEDEDDSKPLEIPFIHKRRSSLFHQKRIQPPQRRINAFLDHSNQARMPQNRIKRSFKEMISSTTSTIKAAELAKKPNVLENNQPSANIVTNMGNSRGDMVVLTANLPKQKQSFDSISSRQHLLIPNMPMETDILSKTLIKSPFASTLFFQEDKSNTLLGNFKSNDSLLNSFQQQQFKIQSGLFQKEVTPRSLIDIMLTGGNKGQSGESNNTATTIVNEQNAGNRENESSEPTII